MRNRFNLLSTLLAAALVATSVLATRAEESRGGSDTSFSYQGRLLDSWTPASAPIDIQVELWSAETEGFQIGPTLSFGAYQPIGGLIELQLEFNTNIVGSRWLQFAVGPAGGTLVPLSPRRLVGAAPRARRADFAGEATSLGGELTVNPSDEIVGSATVVSGIARISGGGNLDLNGDAGGGPDLRVAADGRVGIGATIPGTTLDVVGVGRFEDAMIVQNAVGGGNEGGEIILAEGGASAIGETPTTWNIDVFGTGANSQMRFFKVGRPELSIGSSGFLNYGDFLYADANTDRLGVNTNAPAARLHVASGSLRNAAVVSATTSGGTWFSLHNNNAGRYWHAILSGASSPGAQQSLLIGDSADLTTVEPNVLMEAGGDVAIGTLDAQARLHVATHNEEALRLEGTSTLGTRSRLSNSSPGGRSWSLHATGEESPEGAGHLLLVDDAAGANRLFVDGATGNVGVGTSSAPTSRLVVSADAAGANDDDSTGYAARLENAASEGDGLWIQLADDPAGEGNNFIQFANGVGTLGTIQANAAGDGVEYLTAGADFAEELPKLDPKETIRPGDVVGVFGGKIGKRVAGADWAMVVSGRPAFVGNVRAGEENRGAVERVAFVGQIATRVVGRVAKGDFVVASGREDGTAIAIAPESLAARHAGLVVGRAWESSAETGEKLVNVVVGLPESAAMTGALLRELAARDERIERLEARLARLERSLLGGLEAASADPAPRR
jgi:hypothetical protein